jgi:hypothetical protein
MKQMKPRLFTKREDIEDIFTFTGICEYRDGRKEWLVKGELHREDGPAIEYFDGSRQWWVNGKCHRLDGPACEWMDGEKQWYIDDKEYTKNKFNKHPLVVEHKEKMLEKESIKIVRYEDIKDFSTFTGICEDVNKIKSWYVDGKRHREDGPAIEWHDGTKSWYAHGKEHRTDGPAIEKADGRKCWIFDGKIHRLDGPAIEWPNGYKEWYIGGERYSEEEFNKHPLVIEHRQNNMNNNNLVTKERNTQIQQDLHKCKKDFFCNCANNDHIVRFYYDQGDSGDADTLDINIKLNQYRSFFARLVAAFCYIFNIKTTKEADWDTVVLCKNQIKELSEFISSFETTETGENVQNLKMLPEMVKEFISETLVKRKDNEVLSTASTPPEPIIPTKTPEDKIESPEPETPQDKTKLLAENLTELVQANVPFPPGGSLIITASSPPQSAAPEEESKSSETNKPKTVSPITKMTTKKTSRKETKKNKRNKK